MASGKIKVLHIVPEWLESSGPCTFIKLFIQKTCHFDIVHEIISFSESQNNSLYPLLIFEYIGLSKWKYSPSFKLYFKKNKAAFNLIHLHGSWIYANYLIAQSGIPYIYKPSGGLQPIPMSFDILSFKKIYLRLVEKKIAIHSQFIHSLSFLEKKNLMELGFSSENIKVLPLIDKIVESPYPMKIRKNQIIYLGRLTMIKNLQFIGELASELLSEHKDLCWIIAGGLDSEYARELKKYFHKILPPENFKFTGELNYEEKHQYLRTSKILIHPSLSENFCHSIAESLGNQTPVITSKNSPWEILNSYKAGFNLDMNLYDWKNGVIQILNNFEEYHIGAKKAYQYLISLDSTEKILSEYIKISG